MINGKKRDVTCNPKLRVDVSEWSSYTLKKTNLFQYYNEAFNNLYRYSSRARLYLLQWHEVVACTHAQTDRQTRQLPYTSGATRQKSITSTDIIEVLILLLTTQVQTDAW